MTNRERTLAVLNYENYDALPIIHFGFWKETLKKWSKEGHISQEEALLWKDGNRYDCSVGEKLAFDFNWHNCYSANPGLWPAFQEEVIDILPDGTRYVRTEEGAVVQERDGAGSIRAEVDHLLKRREDWERHYRWRLQPDERRLSQSIVYRGGQPLPFGEGGLEFLRDQGGRQNPLGLHCGSLFGVIRNIMGLEGISYLYADDEALYEEIIDTVAEISYWCAASVLDRGARFEFGHFWEDICAKNGPLVNPRVFREKVGHHYRRFVQLLRSYGTGLVSVDCDGFVDQLIPVWLDNGVNVMFPIEVGTWHASIGPWRERYGRAIRGVGGVDKRIFARDTQAVDREIERMKPLIALGGYLPCPDHRLPPDAQWGNVQYYCERMRKTFGG